MLFKYTLTDDQYAASKKTETFVYIDQFTTSIGCTVSDKKVVNNIDTWEFSGKFKGNASLVRCDRFGFPVDPHNPNGHWELWLRITKKPWYVFWFVINRKIKQTLLG